MSTPLTDTMNKTGRNTELLEKVCPNDPGSDPKNENIETQPDGFPERVVDEIIDDMTDRRGLRHEWYNIDEEIQEEIRSTWIEIVRTALTRNGGPENG